MINKSAIYFTVCASSMMLAGCSPSTKRFDELKIESVESGPVPASTVPDLPAKEEEVIYKRGNAGIVTAYYRKTVPCPSRMIYGTVGIKPMADRILLCFEPVEATSPEATPLSACPYKLAAKFEMTGIPKSVEPKFEVAPSCTGFPAAAAGK